MNMYMVFHRRDFRQVDYETRSDAEEAVRAEYPGCEIDLAEGWQVTQDGRLVAVIVKLARPRPESP